MPADMRLSTLLALWRPGSHDWSWQEEAYDLRLRVPAKLDALRASMAYEGVREPVVLGHDGRVWDGHHRIVAAIEAHRDHLPVEFVASSAAAPAPTEPPGDGE